MAFYARLREEWLLRGCADVPWFIVNWRTGECLTLQKDGFYVAQSCDGQTDFSSMAFLPRHIALLDKFIADGIAIRCQAPKRLEPIQQYRQAQNPMIRGIHWAITGRCNMHCRYCYMEAPSGQKVELDFNDTKNLINQFEQANVSSISLTGGEPFMRKDLLELIALLADKKIRLVDIYSNGTLIAATSLQELKALGVNPIFRISFDGCGTHDLMRGTTGAESLVLDAISRIRAAGFEVSVTTSVDRTNVSSLMTTYEQMKKLDLYSWGVARPQPVGCGRGLTTGLSLEEMAEPCKHLLHRWLEDGRPFMIGLEAFYSGAGNMAAIQTPPASRDTSPESYVCRSCREWPHVTSDGKLLPCIGYTDTVFMDSMPNLLETGLTEAWNDSSLRSLLDVKMKDVLDHNKECVNCEMLDECGTGCRASALVSSGALWSRDSMSCQLWKNGYKQQFSEIASEWERKGDSII